MPAVSLEVTPGSSSADVRLSTHSAPTPPRRRASSPPVRSHRPPSRSRRQVADEPHGVLVLSGGVARRRRAFRAPVAGPALSGGSSWLFLHQRRGPPGKPGGVNERLSCLVVVGVRLDRRRARRDHRRRAGVGRLLGQPPSDLRYRGDWAPDVAVGDGAARFSSALFGVVPETKESRGRGPRPRPCACLRRGPAQLVQGRRQAPPGPRSPLTFSDDSAGHCIDLTAANGACHPFRSSVSGRG